MPKSPMLAERNSCHLWPDELQTSPFRYSTTSPIRSSATTSGSRPGAKNKCIVRKWDGTWAHDPKEFVVCSITNGPLVVMPRVAFDGHNSNVVRFGGTTTLHELAPPAETEHGRATIRTETGDGRAANRHHGRSAQTV